MTGTIEDIRLARSMAGHDRGKIYVVVGEEPEVFYLADGTTRTVEAPKKKNRRHVQIIKKIPGPVRSVFTSGDQPTDAEIKRALKLYHLTDKKQEET